MKKLLIICLGLFAFSCTPDRGANENDHATSNENIDLGSDEDNVLVESDTIQMDTDTL